MNFSKLNDKLLHAVIIATVFRHNFAFADDDATAATGGSTTPTNQPMQALPNTPYETATLPEIAGRADSAASWFYTFIRSFAICLGLYLVISSLMKVKSISAGEKEGSLFGAWAGAFIGGMVAFSTVWMWAFGKTVKEVVGA